MTHKPAYFIGECFIFVALVTKCLYVCSGIREKLIGYCSLYAWGLELPLALQNPVVSQSQSVRSPDRRQFSTCLTRSPVSTGRERRQRSPGSVYISPSAESFERSLPVYSTTSLIVPDTNTFKMEPSPEPGACSAPRTPRRHVTPVCRRCRCQHVIRFRYPSNPSRPAGQCHPRRSSPEGGVAMCAVRCDQWRYPRAMLSRCSAFITMHICKAQTLKSPKEDTRDGPKDWMEKEK